MLTKKPSLLLCVSCLLATFWGYPAAADDYGLPDYGAPAPDYGAPAPDYGAPASDPTTAEPTTQGPDPAPDYGAPAPDYGAPAPDYGAPAPDYGAPASDPTTAEPEISTQGLDPVPDYGAPAPDYGAPAPDYDAPAPDYEPSGPDPTTAQPESSTQGPDPGDPAPDYGAPAPDYGAPAPDYEPSGPDPTTASPINATPAPDYGDPAPDYGAPAPDYGAPAPDYGAPAPDYEPSGPDPTTASPINATPAPDYGDPAPDYGAPAPDYGAPAPDYGAPAPDYEPSGPDPTTASPINATPAPDYGDPAPDYGAPAPDYGAPAPDYGAPAPDYEPSGPDPTTASPINATPAPDYGDPAPDYGAPAPDYGAPAPDYGAPAPDYEPSGPDPTTASPINATPAPDYGDPAPDYGAPAPDYGAPAPDYGAPAPDYEPSGPDPTTASPINATPAPDYGDPAPDYGAPAPDYGAPAPDYGAPAPDYEPSGPDPTTASPINATPAPDYGDPAPDYGAPAPDYGAPAPDYDAPAPDYEPSGPDPTTPSSRSATPAPDYGAPAPDYGAPAPDYEAPAPDYDVPAPDYDAPAPDYDAPAPDYDAPAPDYGPPGPDYDVVGDYTGPTAEDYGSPLEPGDYEVTDEGAFAVDCGEDATSPMRVTYTGSATMVYPAAVDPSDCQAVVTAPFIYVIENVNTAQCGIMVTSNTSVYYVDIVAQQGAIRLASDPLFSAQCVYDAVLEGEPGVEGEVLEGIVAYTTSFVPVGGNASGSVVMELLDLYGTPITHTSLGQIVRISIKFYTEDPVEQSLRIWECQTMDTLPNPQYSYTFIFIGCGDGDNFKSYRGFYTFDSKANATTGQTMIQTVSPLFRVFHVKESSRFHFQCQIIVCKEHDVCRGSSCAQAPSRVAGRRKRDVRKMSARQERVQALGKGVVGPRKDVNSGRTRERTSLSHLINKDYFDQDDIESLNSAFDILYESNQFHSHSILDLTDFLTYSKQDGQERMRRGTDLERDESDSSKDADDMQVNTTQDVANGRSLLNDTSSLPQQTTQPQPDSSTSNNSPVPYYRTTSTVSSHTTTVKEPVEEESGWFSGIINDWWPVMDSDADTTSVNPTVNTQSSIGPDENMQTTTPNAHDYLIHGHTMMNMSEMTSNGAHDPVPENNDSESQDAVERGPDSSSRVTAGPTTERDISSNRTHSHPAALEHGDRNHSLHDVRSVSQHNESTNQLNPSLPLSSHKGGPTQLGDMDYMGDAPAEAVEAHPRNTRMHTSGDCACPCASRDLQEGTGIKLTSREADLLADTQTAREQFMATGVNPTLAERDSAASTSIQNADTGSESGSNPVLTMGEPSPPANGRYGAQVWRTPAPAVNDSTMPINQSAHVDPPPLDAFSTDYDGSDQDRAPVGHTSNREDDVVGDSQSSASLAHGKTQSVRIIMDKEKARDYKLYDDEDYTETDENADLVYVDADDLIRAPPSDAPRTTLEPAPVQLEIPVDASTSDSSLPENSVLIIVAGVIASLLAITLAIVVHVSLKYRAARSHGAMISSYVGTSASRFSSPIYLPPLSTATGSHGERRV